MIGIAARFLVAASFVDGAIRRDAVVRDWAEARHLAFSARLRRAWLAGPILLSFEGQSVAVDVALRAAHAVFGFETVLVFAAPFEFRRARAREIDAVLRALAEMHRRTDAPETRRANALTKSSLLVIAQAAVAAVLVRRAHIVTIASGGRGACSIDRIIRFPNPFAVALPQGRAEISRRRSLARRTAVPGRTTIEQGVAG